MKQLTDTEIKRMLIPPTHKQNILDRLAVLPGRSLFAMAIRGNVKTEPDGVLIMILSQAKDNRRLVAEIVGEDLLTEIEKL